MGFPIQSQPHMSKHPNHFLLFALHFMYFPLLFFFTGPSTCWSTISKTKMNVSAIMLKDEQPTNLSNLKKRFARSAVLLHRFNAFFQDLRLSAARLSARSDESQVERLQKHSQYLQSKPPKNRNILDHRYRGLLFFGRYIWSYLYPSMFLYRLIYLIILEVHQI